MTFYRWEEPDTLHAPFWKQKMYGLQGGCCAGCGDQYAIAKLTVDHKVPLSKGGSDRRPNLQLLCPGCNTAKADLSQEEFEAVVRAWKDQGRRCAWCGQPTEIHRLRNQMGELICVGCRGFPRRKN